MASARELLEQADALMRKNRGHGDGDIPLLTDAVGIADAPAPAAISLRAAEPAAGPALVAVAPDADVPVLTDRVEEVLIDFGTLPPEREALGAIMEGDPSDWLVMDTIDPSSHSITGRAPDTLAVVPPVTLRAAGSAATPPPEGSQAREEVPPHAEPDAQATFEEQVLPAVEQPARAPVEHGLPAPPHQLASSDSVMKTTLPAESAPAAADQELRRELAEQISMQVLQRLDLFTDSGLKSQLAQRLEPIVERASAELVGAITEQVGRLVRTYVSEAIEREIAQWKSDQH